MRTPDDPAHDEILAERIAIETRVADQETRRHAPGAVAIVDAEELMRQLTRYRPWHLSPEAEEGYLAAIKDIALQINAATLEHDTDTGALRRESAGLTIAPTEVVDSIRSEVPGPDESRPPPG